jgi:uncharacterized protein (DUF2062 family)
MNKQSSRTIKQRFLGLLRLNNTPKEIALGVAIGVFIAILPVYGLHTVLVVIFALLVRRANRIAILAGTNISLPPTLPFITWAGYSLGRLIAGKGYPALSWSVFKGFSYKSIFRFYFPLFIGSFVLGIICAVIFYFFTLWFINRRRRRHLPVRRESGNSVKKTAIFLAAVLTLITCSFLSAQTAVSPDYTGEKIVYEISPLGVAEYQDLGMVEFRGDKASLVIFKTRVLGFDDREKIYSVPRTFLPIRVERDITMWLGKEYIFEEYDQKNFSLVIEKFSGGKKVNEYKFKKDGPINNAVTLPFYLRNVAELDIGWSFIARFPDKFEVKLVSIEEIEVPAGKFKAYYFTSTPRKFEIWISKDGSRVPLRIKGLGGLGYTLSMKKRISGKEQAVVGYPGRQR